MSVGSTWRQWVRMAAVVAGTALVGIGAPGFVAPAGAAATSAGGYRHGTVAPVSGTSGGAGPAAPATSGGNLTYQGGNGGVGVTTGAPLVYVVFWGSQWGASATNGQGYLTLSGDPAGLAPDLQGFFQGLGTAGETWSGVMTQYCEGVAAGAQTCPSGAAHVGYPTGGALAGVWADTSVAAPSSPTGHQLAVEAVAAANHFGRTTQAANRNTQYFVVSPTGTTPDGFNTSSGQFCAWHDFSADSSLPGGAANSPFTVAFTNFPYLTDAGSSCGKNFVNSGTAGLLDGVTIVGGHEYAETITDQFPAGGWLDGAGNENGDKCAWLHTGAGASQNLTLATGTFAVQSTWANDANSGAGGCLVTHSVAGAGTAPTIISASGTVFTTGVAGTFTVTTTGSPTAAITSAGTLPSGVSVTDNHDGTATVAGTAGVGAAGSYPLTLTAANGVSPNATQAFTLTVNQATLTNPVDGQANVDTTLPFTWATIPQAQGYVLTVGTAAFGANLVNSGPLPASQSSFAVPALPAGPTLSATLYAKVAGAWTSYQAVSFTAAPGMGTLTFPLAGQLGVDPTRAFSWATIAPAQGYLLIVGTSQYASNLANSGVLAATQSTFAPPTLPSGVTVYASLFTKVNGAFSRVQSITFTTGPAKALLTNPVNGQLGVATPTTFTWAPIAGAQNYLLIVGTTIYGLDKVNSGVLPPSQSSLSVPALGSGQLLFATLFTRVNGAWTFQLIGFGT